MLEEDLMREGKAAQETVLTVAGATAESKWQCAPWLKSRIFALASKYFLELIASHVHGWTLHFCWNVCAELSPLRQGRAELTSLYLPKASLRTELNEERQMLRYLRTLNPKSAEIISKREHQTS